MSVKRKILQEHVKKNNLFLTVVLQQLLFCFFSNLGLLSRDKVFFFTLFIEQKGVMPPSVGSNQFWGGGFTLTKPEKRKTPLSLTMVSTNFSKWLPSS